MIDLKDFAKEYEANIADFINLCNNKTIIFDFDGTLTKLQYDTDTILPCRDADQQQYTLAGGNIYDKVCLSKTMQYIIAQLPPEDVWVLTATVPALRPIKSAIIVDNFHIPAERIIHTDNAADKIGYLRQIHNRTGKKLLFVEDTLSTLLTAEESFDFVKGFHISNLLV